MQKMDKATLMELEWRDFLFWPFARPLGIIYAPVGYMLGYAASKIIALFYFPFRMRQTYSPDVLQREIFTLANLMTIYGMFLVAQLAYGIFAYFKGVPLPPSLSLSGLLFKRPGSEILGISLLTAEIIVSDLLDGPLARVNNAVTALGTMLDHTRDYLAAFIAIFFLIAVIIIKKDYSALILEAAGLGSFCLVMAYHAKLFSLFARNHQHKIHGHTRNRFDASMELMREFALEEYQTSLTGRIQFASMAVALNLGLFHYALESIALGILFIVALVISIMTTSYYLYELWGAYYEKWQAIAHHKSQELKEKLIEKIKS